MLHKKLLSGTLKGSSFVFEKNVRSISIEEYRRLLKSGKKSPARSRRTCVDGFPSEEDEQRRLKVFLDGLGLPWFHVPNGGARSPAEGGKLKAQGVKKGVSDNFIFVPPPQKPHKIGLVIELKRANSGSTTPEQDAWLDFFAAIGWETAVCHGADAAMALMHSLGYRACPLLADIYQNLIQGEVA